MAGLLEYPQFTRPSQWHDRQVPDVLLSGHQANIDQWQHLESLKETMIRRPDLFAKQKVTADEWEKLINLVKNEK